MPFTPAEKLEVAKVVAAAQLLPVSAGKIASAITAATSFGADQLKYTDAVLLFDKAFRALNAIMQNLLWCYEDDQSARSDRGAAVESAEAGLSSAISLLNAGADELASVAALAAAATALRQASALLQSFDRNLAYDSPLPESYPTIIGPHGNYDLSQSALCISSRMLADSLLGIWALFNDPAWAAAANANLGDLLNASTAAQAKFIRIMGLSAEIASPADQAVIDKYTAQGSGLRPSSFFRAVFAQEVGMMTDATQVTVVGGRHPAMGVGFDLVRTIGAVGAIFAANTSGMADRVRAQMSDGAAYMATFGQAWKHLDDWADANFLFFHSDLLPAAPPGAPPVQ